MVKRMDKKTIIPAISLFIVMVCIIILVLTSGPPFTYISNPGGVNKAVGFSTSKIGLLDASIKCSKGYLEAIITNKAGTNLTSISVNCISGCNESIGELYRDSRGGIEIDEFSAGESAYLRLEGISKIVGEDITVDVTIDFTERIAGKYINRTQSGQIFCTVE